MTTAPKDQEIAGVIFKPLKTFKDDRGFFREVIRVSDSLFTPANDSPHMGFAQWSHSKMAHNVVKAWHYHHEQIDWWYVPIGQVETVLFDNRPESPTFKKKLVFKMGDADKFGPETLEICVKIPPGVLHGCKVLSDEAHLFYITSKTYDPNEEGRFPYNSDVVPHDWGQGVLTVENDRRAFEPKSRRKSVG